MILYAIDANQMTRSREIGVLDNLGQIVDTISIYFNLFQTCSDFSEDLGCNLEFTYNSEQLNMEPWQRENFCNDFDLRTCRQM